MNCGSGPPHRSCSLSGWLRVEVVRRLAVVAALGLAPELFGDDALRQAAEAIEQNDFPAAISHLVEALTDDPNNVNARFNLAYAYQATGAESEAIEEYFRIVEQQPDLAPARQNLGTLLMRGQRFGAAARQFAHLASLQPEDTALQLQLADSSLRAGDAETAVSAYRRAVEMGEESLDVLVGFAGALVNTGRLIEAVPVYLRATRIDASVEELLLVVAEKLQAAGLREDAMELYRRYARNRPDDPNIQHQLGLLLLEEGNLRAARAVLERAVASEPTADRHAALAEVFRLEGMKDTATNHLRLAAEAAPENADYGVRYATALLQNRQFKEAVDQYLVACQADPSSQEAWNGLALAAYQLDNFAGALKALQNAESLGPAPPASVYLKAVVSDRLQYYEEAQAAYRAFLELQPAMPDEVWKAEQRLSTLAKVLKKR